MTFNKKNCLKLLEYELFQDDFDITLANEIVEDQLRSYTKQMDADLESFK